MTRNSYQAVGTGVIVTDVKYKAPPSGLELLTGSNGQQRVITKREPVSIATPLFDYLRKKLIGESWQIEGVRTIVAKILETYGEADYGILVIGETGTGKGLVARLIHDFSTKKDKPFVYVNCAAIPSDLFEAELFGCDRGAFTDAYGSRSGKFELANGGTIFLDEIGSMNPFHQAKILNVLQDRQITRVGGNRPIHFTGSVIAATNTALEYAVSEGKFREDLYYRLNVVNIYIPPLRERKKDILAIAEYLIQKCYDELRGKEVAPELRPKLSEDAKEFLKGYPWPGNIRELENAITSALLFIPVEEGYDNLLRPVNFQSLVPPTSTRNGKYEPLKVVSKRAAMEAEKKAILETLGETRWNRVRAAKILGISYRVFLHKMKLLV